MQPPAKNSLTATPTGLARCRLVFDGDTDPRMPREVALERLRRLLKASPEAFERRLTQLPMALLSDKDSATARGYQRLLAQKGIICRIERQDANRGEHLPDPGKSAAVTERRSPNARTGEATTGAAPRGRRDRMGSLPKVLNLGADLCVNPRGVIGRVLSTAPYRMTLVLAAGVGIVQASSTLSSELRGGAVSALITLLAILILAPVMGILLVYVRGFLLHAAGRILQGQAGRREIRIALAWSEIPLLLGGVVVLLQIGLEALALPAAADGGEGLPGLLRQAGLGLLHAGLGVWALCLLIYTLAEIQKFSLGRAFVSIVLAMVMVLGPLAVLAGILIGAGILPAG